MPSLQTRLYLDPQRHSRSTRLSIPAMGIHEQMPPGFIRHGGPGTGHPYLLMLFHSPVQVLETASGSLRSGAGKLIVWDAPQPHHYGHATRTWDHSWLHVSGSWADRMMHRGEVPLGKLLSIRRPEGVVDYLSLLYDELHGRVRQDPEMIDGIVGLLWQYISREVRSPGQDEHPVDPRMDAARQLLESSFAEKFDLSKAAEIACLSPSYFCQLFSTQFGVPPGEYVTRLRLRRAEQLLMNRELAVFQVATEVGYDDPLYFSRLFRKRYGVSPARYRQRGEA